MFSQIRIRSTACFLNSRLCRRHCPISTVLSPFDGKCVFSLCLSFGVHSILCASLPSAFAAETANSYKIIYDGGSIPDLKAGKDLHLFIDQSQIRLVKDKEQVVVIPAAAVTEISYRQDVHRR